jgi:hypothetical protein
MHIMDLEYVGLQIYPKTWVITREVTDVKGTIRSNRN